MSTPIISVIVPLYNEAEYLPVCLDSLLVQTLKDIEIICVDDGSTDASPQILERYQEKDARIKVITISNSGEAGARNEGLKAARGEWLAFCDADDFVSPYTLEHAVETGERLGVDVVSFGFERCCQNADISVIDDTEMQGKVTVKKPSDFGNLFSDTIGIVWNKIFRHSFVLKYGINFQGLRIRADATFCFPACLMADRIALLDEKLYYYRNVEGSLSHKMNHDIDDVYLFLKGVQDYLDKEGLYESYKRSFVSFSVEHIVYSLSTVYPADYVRVYNKVQKSWVGELRLLGHDKSFFDNSDIYYLTCTFEKVILDQPNCSQENNPMHRFVFSRFSTTYFNVRNTPIWHFLRSCAQRLVK